jgi:hypothetical protein
MRSLASAVLMMTCAIGMGASALAAENTGGHQAPAPMPAASVGAHPMNAPMPAATGSPHPLHASMPAGAARDDHDRDHDHDRDGDHHHGHHRQRILSVPFGFYDYGPAQQAIVAEPDASASEAAPTTPPTDAADRPPCRETSAGVVILRGTGCRRDDR